MVGVFEEVAEALDRRLAYGGVGVGGVGDEDVRSRMRARPSAPAADSVPSGAK